MATTCPAAVPPTATALMGSQYDGHVLACQRVRLPERPEHGCAAGRLYEVCKLRRQLRQHRPAQNANYPVPNPGNPNMFFTFKGAPFTDIGSPAIDDTGYAINFATLTVTKIASVTDGLSNTLMTSELKIPNPGNDLRGYTWWGPSASFTALLTPNSTLQDSMGNGGCYNTISPPCNTAFPIPRPAQAAMRWFTWGRMVIAPEASVRGCATAVSGSSRTRSAS